MKTKVIKFSRIFLINLTIVTILSTILNIFVNCNRVDAAYTQYSKTGISEFPESYQEALKNLSELHPNWTFTAFYTGITWNEFMQNESSLGGSKYAHGKNTVIKSADISWIDSCNTIKSGYACASPDIIAYYADPRNFITEVGMFQFLEMSYNSSVHNKKGVESIIKGTFMETPVTIKEEEKEVPANAKILDKYIISTPYIKNEEIAKSIELEKYAVTDSKNNTLSNTDVAVTGNIIIDTTKNISYTVAVLGDINGDGEVKATDYAKIKNFIMEGKELTEVQKIAADVNEDGEVKATDYAKIKNFIMNGTKIAVKTEQKVNTQTIEYADIIMKAAEESGISPYSIAIKIIQEVGRKGSNSIYGTYPGYEGYYNFFNIGAYDSGNAIENGLKYAKEKGWNNQYKAIIDGAKYMSDSYIGVGQNTAYLYKFDVVDGKNGVFWHQYMTNIEDPSSQAKNLYNTYTKNGLLDASLNFVIPVYNEMPSSCNLPSKIDTSAETSYYVNGTGVNFRSEPSASSSAIGTFAQKEIVTVENLEAGEADGYIWAKVIRANGSTGYIANKYLVKCN